MTPLRPRQRIRRFDVFAEYRRQEAQAEGMPADQARGYGLWVAKVVAARKFGRLKRSAGSGEDKAAPRRRKWHVMGGVPQTSKLFDDQIVERMGREFYREVFEPAVRQAREHGKTYESIRDTIRRRWKPAEPSAA